MRGGGGGGVGGLAGSTAVLSLCVQCVLFSFRILSLRPNSLG